MRKFQAFLASSPCAASASSYHFSSIAPPLWRCAFSRFAPVVNSAVSVLASGSNFAVKPTCLRQAAYFRSLGLVSHTARSSAMQKTTKLRLIGGVMLLFNLWLIGRYNLQGIPVLLLTFGFAFGYEFIVVRPAKPKSGSESDK